MTETPQNPPPGFYPDQQGQRRFWDGTAWTDRVETAPGAIQVAVGDDQERPWFQKKRFVIPGVLVALLVVGAALGGGGAPEETTPVADTATTAEAEVPVDDPLPTEEPSPEPEPEEPELTGGQEDAIGSAENYLELTAFSREGLITQLEFEDYSTEDATFAVDYLDPDFDAQAAEAAENYLELTSFSRQGLIDQLVFEGYTQEQAEYGVSQTNL